MSRRAKISKSLTDLMNNTLDGVQYISNIYGTAENSLKFWDEISSFPYMSITAGDEYREYLPGNFKWAYLNIIIRLYAKGDSSDVELEQFLDDIECVLDLNNELPYDVDDELTSITINSITTDEGVLKPLSVGEMNIQVRYALQGPCPE